MLRRSALRAEGFDDLRQPLPGAVEQLNFGMACDDGHVLRQQVAQMVELRPQPDKIGNRIVGRHENPMATDAWTAPAGRACFTPKAICSTFACRADSLVGSHADTVTGAANDSPARPPPAHATRPLASSRPRRSMIADPEEGSPCASTSAPVGDRLRTRTAMLAVPA
jgi:hypothetical protein